MLFSGSIRIPVDLPTVRDRPCRLLTASRLVVRLSQPVEEPGTGWHHNGQVFARLQAAQLAEPTVLLQRQDVD